jgi:hypothetical protein
VESTDHLKARKYMEIRSPKPPSSHLWLYSPSLLPNSGRFSVVSGVSNAVCSFHIVQNYKVYIKILIWHIRFHVFFMSEFAQLVFWGFRMCRIWFFRRFEGKCFLHL